MNASNPSLCPLCDSTAVEIRHDRKAIYTYLRKQFVLEGQEHTVCNECGTSFYEDGQIERNNARFIAWAKDIVKDIAPWEIRELRERYDLSQEDARRIFNCGSKTQFSKWERGEVAPTGTAALALREALENPAFIKKLAMRAEVTIGGITESQTVSRNASSAVHSSWAWAGRMGRSSAMNHNFWRTPTSDITAPTAVDKVDLHAA